MTKAIISKKTSVNIRSILVNNPLCILTDLADLKSDLLLVKDIGLYAIILMLTATYSFGIFRYIGLFLYTDT